jgi:hypothetical protein
MSRLRFRCSDAKGNIVPANPVIQAGDVFHTKDYERADQDVWMEILDDDDEIMADFHISGLRLTFGDHGYLNATVSIELPNLIKDAEEVILGGTNFCRRMPKEE